MSSPVFPRVSIILPTHDRPLLLREAIASLRSQTISDWEAIVVDDASRPAVEIAEGDPRIRCVRHEVGQGGAAAKNTGIRRARAEVLAFLDDDDRYASQYLERALDALDRHPEIDVVFMGVEWFGSNGAAGQRSYVEAMKRFLIHAGAIDQGTLIVFGESVVSALFKSVPMAFQRPVVRRSAFARIGEYRSDCLLWDCDWAIRAALHARIALLPEGLYLQRADGQAYSSRPERAIEHLQSGIEIKERLWEQCRTGAQSRHLETARLALAEAWFHLAWYYFGQGNRFRALSALLQSARRHAGLPQAKLMARLILLRRG